MTRARKAPPPAAVPALSRFHPGDAIVVSGGLSTGLHGTVRGLDAQRFGNERMYRVDLGGLLGVRVIRETFLS